MRPTSLTMVAALAALTMACGGAPEEPPEEVEVGEAAGEGRILRVDPRLDSLVPPGATIEKLAEGYVFTEGPVWIREESRLLFSDVRANAIHQWTEADGASPFIDPVFEGDREGLRSISSNGLTLDAEGRLIICEHGNRRISRLEEDGTRTVIVDSFEGQPPQQPQRRRLRLRRVALLHRPVVRPRGARGVAAPRARLQRHLPPEPRRRARAAGPGPEPPQRHRPLARRGRPLRRQLRREPEGLDGLRPRRGRRHERARLLRRQRPDRARRRRRPEGRPRRQPLRHRPPAASGSSAGTAFTWGRS